MVSLGTISCADRPGKGYHVFATGHQSLIYDLGSVIAARVDVDAFLDNGVRPSAQGLANLVATWLHLGGWFSGRAITGSIHCLVHCARWKLADGAGA